jgi:hypothetical protein
MDDLMGALVACQRPDQRLAFRQLLTSAIFYAIGWILMVYFTIWLLAHLSTRRTHGRFFSARVYELARLGGVSLYSG